MQQTGRCLYATCLETGGLRKGRLVCFRVFTHSPIGVFLIASTPLVYTFQITARSAQKHSTKQISRKIIYSSWINYLNLPFVIAYS